MPRNHSRYTWGQAGADVGACPLCEREKKVLRDGMCLECRKKPEYYIGLLQARKGIKILNDPFNLDRIRALEGQ